MGPTLGQHTPYWVSECKNRVTNRDRAMIGWKCRRSQTTIYQLSVQCQGQHKQPWREPTIHWTRRYCPWVDWAMSEDRLTCNDISDNDVMERMRTAHQHGLCTPHDLRTTGPQTHTQLFYGHHICISWNPQLRTGGSCCSKVLLSTCPFSWQLEHWD